MPWLSSNRAPNYRRPTWETETRGLGRRRKPSRRRAHLPHLQRLMRSGLAHERACRDAFGPPCRHGNEIWFLGTRKCGVGGCESRPPVTHVVDSSALYRGQATVGVERSREDSSPARRHHLLGSATSGHGLFPAPCCRPRGPSPLQIGLFGADKQSTSRWWPTSPERRRAPSCFPSSFIRR